MLLIKVWSVLLAMLVVIPAPTANYRRMAEKTMKSSVLLHMTGTRIKKGKIVKLSIGCSGTYIAPTRILTAAHCFEDYDLQKVWARGPSDVIGYPVHLITRDHSVDLALVDSAFPHAYSQIGPNPHVGDEVLNVGSPLGFEFVASQGIVSVLNEHPNGPLSSYIVTTAMVDHGSSGGGAFNKKGQLIGVNTLSVGILQWGGLTMAVDVETIQRFLDGN